MPWCYRMNELVEFRLFLEEYKQEYLIDYLKSKGYTQLLIKQSHEVKRFMGADTRPKDGFQLTMFG